MHARFPDGNSFAAAMLATALLCGGLQAQAQEQEDSSRFQGRYELWAGPVSWPGLTDLLPPAGDFDSVGLGIGLGAHFVMRSFEASDLLLGVDLSVSGVDSDIDGYFSSVMAQHFFLGASVKWLFGENRNVSLDAGFGYHEVEIADMSTVFWGIEESLWTSGRWGTWAGVTWDIGSGRPGHSGGLFVAARAHFVDFGNVRDEGPVFEPVLGSGAGKLDGPLYVLEIGYSGR